MNVIKTVSTAVLAGVITLGSFGAATAATLGLTTSTPTLESSFAFVDFLDLSPDGELSSFGAEVDFTDGASPTGFTTIDFAIGYALADPTTGLSGFLDVSDEDGQFLVGDLLAVGFTEDIIELQFGNLTGSGASLFSSSVLALIAFDDPLGANPFASFVDGDSYIASISISNVALIPLPAGLPLLAGGLGALMVLRRRKAA